MRLAVFLALTLTATSAIAAQPQQVHTWHNVNAANGSWHGQLQMISEKGSFVGPDGTTPLSQFSITPSQPQKFGFSFDMGDDFDVAYTVTMIEKSESSSSNFTSKTCVFVCSAKGAAQPDIRVSSYNGATCDWKAVPGVGEDYFVS